MAHGYVRRGPPQRSHQPIRYRARNGKREKLCKLCGRWLECSPREFHRNGSQTGGLRHDCKLCHRGRRAVWYARNLDEAA